MLKNLKITIFILLMVFTSCVKETVDPRMDNTIATSRTANVVRLEIRTTDGNIIVVNAIKVAVGNATATSFTVVADPHTANAVSYTAVAVTVTSETGHLRIVKDPGIGQVTYVNKYAATITANGVNGLLVTINPGDVVTTFGIVVDEMDNF
jgi:hypothetical protein